MNHLTECSKSELDLFQTFPTNNSITTSKFVYYQSNPVDVKTQSQFDILVQGSEEYLDLNDIFMEVEVNIPDFSKDPNKLLAPINNFGHSLFKNIELYISHDKEIDTAQIDSGVNYEYKAYLLNLLNYDASIKHTWLQLGIWEKDVAGQFDKDTNTGFLNRRKLFIAGKDTVKLIFPLHLDFLKSNKFLMAGFNLKFSFTRNIDKFLLHGSGSKDFKVLLNSAKIRTRKCTINPSVSVALKNAWQFAPLRYPIKQNKIFLHTITKGETSCSPSFTTIVPNKIIFGLVKEASFYGDLNNPFNFEPFKIQVVKLTIDSDTIEIKVDSEKNDYVDGYHSLFQSLNYYNVGTNSISLEEYIGGNCLFSFNLNQDKGCDEQFNHHKNGNIGINLQFGEAQENLRLIVLMEFDNQININSSGKTFFDYVGIK